MYDHKVLQEAINDSISFSALLENHLDAGWELIKLEFYTSSGSAFGFAVLRKPKSEEKKGKEQAWIKQQGISQAELAEISMR